MTKKILLLFSFAAYLVSAQNPNLLWFKNYGGTDAEFGTTVRKVPNNGFIISGFTRSNDFDIINNHGDQDIFLIKLDDNRNIQWQKSYGGSNRDWFATSNTLQLTSDGGYIFTGTTYSNNGDVIRPASSYASIWVVKVNSVGNIEWQKTIGEINKGYFSASVNVLGDGNIVVSGYGDNKAILTKLDPNGNLIWEKVYPGAYLETNILNTKLHNNGFILVGHDNLTSNSLFSKIRIINVDIAGNLIWDKNYSYQNADRNYTSAVIADPDGKFVIAGIYGLYGGYKGLAIKLDALGNVVWENVFTNSSNVFDLNSGIINENNEYVFCGGFDSNRFLIAKFSSNGTKTGESIITGDIGGNLFYDIIEDGNGKYIAIGGTKSNSITSPFQFPIMIKGQHDIALFKISGISNLSTDDFLTNTSEITFYPNPSSNIVHIKSKKSIISVKVFSVEGKLVMHKKAKDIQSIDISEIPSGVYSCEFLHADQLKIYEKIIKK
ncbi:T9SS type A sorting domain-containing protein [Chryseobacterium nepalense]|uniref:T9SS type A sorting domain-containing protein n=1 Tax=Chryseobacterium nepalense TaxID=1854498 RepID=UPI002DFE239A|nr:hypothetical protein [Chryseobacterium nepalense]